MYYIKQLNNSDSLNKFVRKMNQSFKARSTEKIPYQQIFIDDIRKKNGIVLGAYDDKNLLVGGLCIEFIVYPNLKLARIYHVWTDLNFQKKGIAFLLMNRAEEICILSGCAIMVLNVANIYIPAVNLYKKVGFKEYKIFANLPKTFYLIQMIKPIDGSIISEKKRRIEWIKSKIKFKIFFRNDSSPTIVNRLYFKIFSKET